MANSVRQFKETVEMQETSLRRITAHRYFPAAVLLLAFLLVACGHIWQRTHVIKVSQELAALQKEHEDLIDLTKKADMEISSLSKATRIQAFAADSLGMKPLVSERVFALNRQAVDTTPVKSAEGELASMVSSIKRIGDYIPVLSETEAEASELQPIKFDSTHHGEGVLP